MRGSIAIGVLAAILGASCTEPRPEECRKVCKREAECLEETGAKVAFEEKECVAACAALRQDIADNGAKVTRHIDCVNNAPTCPLVLKCP